MVKTFIPSQGDIVSVQFNPQAGKEQAGRRPALILSPQSYNEKVGLCVACPITKQNKGYPFEVKISAQSKTRGVILADHLKNLDWRVRKVRFIEKASPKTLEEVLDKCIVLLQKV